MTTNNEAGNIGFMDGAIMDLFAGGADDVTQMKEQDIETKEQDGGLTTKTKKDGAKGPKKTTKPDQRYPNIGNGVAFTKSVTVSNGAMLACDFGTFVAALDAGDEVSGIKMDDIVVKTVQGRTARKDAQSIGVDDKKDSTLYRGDEATLPAGMDSVSILFELSVRNAVKRPHSISGQGYRRLLSNGFFDRITEVSKDIFHFLAENVFSGNWAWRNRDEASDFRVRVTTVDGQVIDGADALAERMFDAFMGRPAHFQVQGVFRLGTGAGSTPVFPSQLMAIKEDKRFFEVNTADGQSIPALRGVKIGNRLREMDVWYRNYEHNKDYRVCLPVEPLGYSMWLSELLREEDETLIHYLNVLMGDDTEAEKVLSDPSAMRFVCGNMLFGFLATEKK